MHVMPAGDLSASILSAVIALHIHEILAAIALLNSVTALLTMCLSNSLFQQGISFLHNRPIQPGSNMVDLEKYPSSVHPFIPIRFPVDCISVSHSVKYYTSQSCTY